MYDKNSDLFTVRNRIRFFAYSSTSMHVYGFTRHDTARFRLRITWPTMNTEDEAVLIGQVWPLTHLNNDFIDYLCQDFFFEGYQFEQGNIAELEFDLGSRHTNINSVVHGAGSRGLPAESVMQLVRMAAFEIEAAQEYLNKEGGQQ